ncbi:MAG: riboflavin kinase [Sediminibacterium sp.]
MTVHVYDFIRGEVKFNGLEALKAQLNEDRKTAAIILSQYP